MHLNILYNILFQAIKESEKNQKSLRRYLSYSSKNPFGAILIRVATEQNIL